MSAETQSGAGRREVAYRLFAAEYDDAELEHSSGEEERAPNYVITPTGARVNRLFVVGVLTEVEEVSEEVLRARVVDPTGAFVIYAGQYQPDAQTFLERAEPPMFVSVTGKARAFRPEGSNQVLTSIRPESINEVDADTRDRWTVQAAEHTLERIATFAPALGRPERGDDLRAALVESGVDVGLASGIPLAIEHYDTTTAYLDALRDVAIGAAEVVAGERDEIPPLEPAPDEGGDVPVDVDAEAVEIEGAPETGAETVVAAGDAPTEAEPGEPTPEEPESVEAEVGADSGVEPEPEPATEIEPDDPGPAGEDDDLGDFDEYGTDEEPETDEMYELDEDEREEIEEEYGTDFSTGTEVSEPGEADIETPEPEGVPDSGTGAEPPVEEGSEPAPEDADVTDDPESESIEEEPIEVEAEPEAKAGAETAPDEAMGREEAAEVDLEDAVVDAMRELDSGDGADRDAVIDAVVGEYGADADAVEDAVEGALMSGKCYEPDEGRLKAI